jgi:radical SAM superfamily enzyme YgiQ (UPF0313 family)
MIKGFYIIGFATDDRESIEMTIKHAQSIPLTDIVATIFTPFPNTYAEVQARQCGKILYERDWSKFNNWSIVYLPGDLTAEELYTYWKRMYKEFYFRPITIWRHLKQIKNFTAVQRYFRGMKVLIKTLV